ncbi:hypothetical protein B6N60_03636 [Richelia sinica FACHB-800]|uniref:Uncharacterized protein n=1 Tax=Richelia sinica FACHB-800 TaxID=1357546 RepID=A0A975TBL7_9NOST|nr:hypothetical protein B6N60_03636 [Richelia sinica FACHB-800]
MLIQFQQRGIKYLIDIKFAILQFTFSQKKTMFNHRGI